MRLPFCTEIRYGRKRVCMDKQEEMNYDELFAYIKTMPFLKDFIITVEVEEVDNEEHIFHR